MKESKNQSSKLRDVCSVLCRIFSTVEGAKYFGKTCTVEGVQCCVGLSSVLLGYNKHIGGLPSISVEDVQYCGDNT